MKYWEAQRLRLVEYLVKDSKKGRASRGAELLRYMHPEVQPGAMLSLMGSLFAEGLVFSPRHGYFKLTTPLLLESYWVCPFCKHIFEPNGEPLTELKKPSEVTDTLFLATCPNCGASYRYIKDT